MIRHGTMIIVEYSSTLNFHAQSGVSNWFYYNLCHNVVNTFVTNKESNSLCSDFSSVVMKLKLFIKQYTKVFMGNCSVNFVSFSL